MTSKDNFLPGEQTRTPPGSFIAVVDDDESFLRALKRVLRSAGFPVETFSSGRNFLDSLATSIPACVVLDVQMPELGGFEVQERLAALNLILPVVFITAHDTPQFRLRAQQSGTAGLLTKPFDGESLLQVVCRALRIDG